MPYAFPHMSFSAKLSAICFLFLAVFFFFSSLHFAVTLSDSHLPQPDTYILISSNQPHTVMGGSDHLGGINITKFF